MFFKRIETTLKILEVIKKVKPSKIYLLSDGGRNDDEKKLIYDLRTKIENFIDWDCSIIKFYQQENIGVYNQIALGAKKVFNLEKKAIFLEDDNLPSLTFFQYCDELLDYYADNPRVFWICGTNYFPQVGNGNPSYYFTQQLLPCGWASWSNKFLKYYDFNFDLVTNLNDKLTIKKFYSKQLYNQQKESIMNELKHKKLFGRYSSWDYHLILTLLVNNLYGILPYKNQVENIGVDINSAHGGNSFNNPMVKRFCGIQTNYLEFPLKKPLSLVINKELERKIADKIQYPFLYKLKLKILYISSRIIRFLFKIPDTLTIKNFFNKNKNE